MRRSAVRLLVIGGILWLNAVAIARAEETKTTPAPGAMCPICTHLNQQQPYPAQAGTLLARGAANMLLGWTEMIRQPAQEAKEGHSAFTGIGKGVNRSVKRTLSGAGELLTFWMPRDRSGRATTFAEDCPLCMGRKK